MTAKRKAEPVDCCRAWMAMAASQREQWHWQVIHRFAHSRTSFSVATLAELARVEPAEAVLLVESAEVRKWIWTPQDGIWVGQLPHRR